MKYLVVYDSKTGNTQLLANELYEILKNKVDVIDILTVDDEKIISNIPEENIAITLNTLKNVRELLEADK